MWIILKYITDRKYLVNVLYQQAQDKEKKANIHLSRCQGDLVEQGQCVELQEKNTKPHGFMTCFQILQEWNYYSYITQKCTNV